MEYSQNTALEFLLKKCPALLCWLAGFPRRLDIESQGSRRQIFWILVLELVIFYFFLNFHDLYPDVVHVIACEPSKVMGKVGKHMTQDIEKVIWIDMLAQTTVYDYTRSFDVVCYGGDEVR